MKSILFAGLDDERAKDLRGDFKSSLLIRKRIIEVLKDKVETNRKKLRGDENYSKPAWAYSMADGAGYERALFEIMALLDDGEKSL